MHCCRSRCSSNLGRAYTSGRRRNKEIDWYTDWLSKRSSAWTLSLCGDKTGAFTHHKAVSFKIVFVPILNCGHESWVMTQKDTISSASGKDGIFAKSLRCDASRQSAQLWNLQRPECRTTSANRKIPAKKLWPRYQNVRGKVGESSWPRTHGTTVQRSSKGQVAGLNLRPSLLVPSWCEASRTIRSCWKQWHLSSPGLAFFFLWDILVICLITVLKLALTVCTNLPFQTFWPNWLNFFGH